MTNLNDICNTINKEQKKNMSKKTTKGWLDGLGCFTMIFFLLVVVLLVIPLILAIGGLLWGCVIYAVWNWVVVPVAAAPVLTFFWQCFILGAALTLVLGALKTVVKKD